MTSDAFVWLAVDKIGFGLAEERSGDQGLLHVAKCFEITTQSCHAFPITQFKTVRSNPIFVFE